MTEEEQIERRKDDRQKELFKEAIRETVTEWAEEKYRTVGKWTIGAVGVFVITLMAHIWVSTHGVQIKAALGAYVDGLAH